MFQVELILKGLRRPIWIEAMVFFVYIFDMQTTSIATYTNCKSLYSYCLKTQWLHVKLLNCIKIQFQKRLSYLKNPLEENEGFCNYKEQLVVTCELHQTFIIGLRLVIIWRLVVVVDTLNSRKKVKPLQKSHLMCDSFATCLRLVDL